MAECVPCVPPPRRGQLVYFSDHLWWEGYREMASLLLWLVAQRGARQGERWARESLGAGDPRPSYAGGLYDRGALAALRDAFGGDAGHHGVAPGEAA